MINLNLCGLAQQRLVKMLSCVLVLFVFSTPSTLCMADQAEAADLVIANVRLYSEPGAGPQDGVSIAIREGKIIEISRNVPTEGAQLLNAGGRTATAGLWNSHVHFTNPALKTEAEGVIRDMLLRYGFTSVVDTGSYLADTLALSQQIEQGRITGPEIMLASGSFVYTGGTPSYLKGIKLPEISTPEQAGGMVGAVLDSGAHGIKIFSGSFMSPTDTVHLPPEIIRAVSDAAHARGGFVIAHPTDRIGLTNAVKNGVDILAHTAPGPQPLGDALIAAMKKSNVALIPTLKLWSYELQRAGVPDEEIKVVEGFAVAQLAEYYASGGEILFGTDTGYMSDFNTRDEFVLMNRAGMDFNAILASMTTNPAQRFADKSGKVEVGAAANIVIYAGDPASDISQFSQIQYTIKDGKVVFRSL